MNKLTLIKVKNKNNTPVTKKYLEYLQNKFDQNIELTDEDKKCIEIEEIDLPDESENSKMLCF